MAEYRSNHQQGELRAVLASRPALAGDSVGRVDLGELNLTGLSVESSTFRNTCLVKATLPESRWIEVRFEGAELRQANLSGALLEGCSVDQGRFMELDLSGARVASCYLQRSFLSRINLSGARVSACEFDDSDMTAANFEGATVIHCRFVAPRALGGLNLARANLRGARFIDCDLRELNVREADLSGATFISCDLRGANLCEATLDDCSFVSCNAEAINLERSDCQGMRHAGTRFFHALTAGAAF